MQVVVFISKPASSEASQKEEPRLLVLPDSAKAAIPTHLRDIDWSYFATTSSADKLIGGQSERIEEALKLQGFCVIAPTY
ncbi:hypothetical protein GCM10007989_33750 [Devosia pacifica]|uniref:Uncharacterized protein n=1 Tax=Devosia pacifica TaxID=1335967 RepID=A0A918SDP9_9HYPH|nr:hypothetical protein [Devosia pacifica]GHA35077.1 hypothetical protein GCM10007989_33750 [Devosia pacifica]